MKTYQVDLTETELDIIHRSLDLASTKGIETSRALVRIADKIAGARAEDSKPSVDEVREKTEN